jgi:hypothetical protein
VNEVDRGNLLIMKAVKWGASTAEQIEKAGGHPESVLSTFSDESITTMVRNNLHIVFKEPGT